MLGFVLVSPRTSRTKSLFKKEREIEVRQVPHTTCIAVHLGLLLVQYNHYAATIRIYHVLLCLFVVILHTVWSGRGLGWRARLRKLGKKKREKVELQQVPHTALIAVHLDTFSTI